MQFLIYLIIGIIYAIASASGYNGRYSRYNRRLNNQDYGRYGLIGVGDDFSLSFDPLERIREQYNLRLQSYYLDNKPRLYLKNNFCELRLITDGSGAHFYCKEKTDGKRKGRFFEVKGNSDHSSTMWAIIDMEFTKRSDYNSVRKLYRSLNQGYETRGGLRYFYEPWRNKYPNYDDKSAQNEYCRLELQEGPNKKFVILCSEIWSRNPKQFVISGNKYLLQNIISNFAEEKNKFYSYTELLAKYSVRLDCKVKELDNSNIENQPKTQQPILNPEPQKQPVKTEEIKVDSDDTIKEKDETSNIEQDDIPKYDERNLDL